MAVFEKGWGLLQPVANSVPRVPRKNNGYHRLLVFQSDGKFLMIQDGEVCYTAYLQGVFGKLADPGSMHPLNPAPLGETPDYWEGLQADCPRQRKGSYL